jgi:surfeit locus 1 family protein
MPLTRRFLLAAALAASAFAVLVMLGTWQMQRLEWKEQLIANVAERPSRPVQELPPAGDWSRLDVAAHEYLPYRLSGRFLHEKEALVFTSLGDAKGRYEGPGYWVVTPFALEGGGTVLVNRGFAPHGRHLPRDRGESLDDGPVTVTGLMRPNDPPNFLTPENQPQANQFFSRHVEAIAAAKQLPNPVAPFTIDLLAGATPPGGLPQAGETRMTFTNNHLAYAVTWYGLAAALLAIFASFVWSRRRERSQGRRLTSPGSAP